MVLIVFYSGQFRTIPNEFEELPLPGHESLMPREGRINTYNTAYIQELLLKGDPNAKQLGGTGRAAGPFRMNAIGEDLEADVTGFDWTLMRKMMHRWRLFESNGQSPGMAMHLWMGPAGVSTLLHYDSSENFIFQVRTWKIINNNNKPTAFSVCASV
jgi:hypothetical protein